MANAIKKYPVPLIFKKIFKDQLSGELVVKGAHFMKNMYFIKGDLVFATTSVQKERLGDILVAAGKISETDFTKMSRVKENSTRRVGEILVEITNLSRHEIFYALLYQVKLIALSTFKLADGEWAFTGRSPKIPGNQKFHIKIPEILTEGIKKIKTFDYYKNRFNYRSPVTTSIPESTGKFLSSDEIKFYIKLTTFPNTSVEEVIKGLHAPEDFFWRNVILLYLLNVVDFVEYTVNTEQNQNIEEINEIYEKIKSKKVDYYQLFGVKKSASVTEIKDTYFDFSKKYHPDRIRVAPDSTVKLRANEVFAEINKAYDVLSNQEKKRSYDMQGRNPTTPATGGTLNARRQAKDLYFKANALFKAKQYWKAANMMENAVKLDPERPSYYLLLGLCQSKLPQTLKTAEKNLKKAADMEPWNADPVFALGELYRSSNFVKKADVQFKKALELNLDHTLAGKAIKELEALYSPKKKQIFSVFGKKK